MNTETIQTSMNKAIAASLRELADAIELNKDNVGLRAWEYRLATVTGLAADNATSHELTVEVYNDLTGKTTRESLSLLDIVRNYVAPAITGGIVMGMVPVMQDMRNN